MAKNGASTNYTPHYRQQANTKFEDWPSEFLNASVEDKATKLKQFMLDHPKDYSSLFYEGRMHNNTFKIVRLFVYQKEAPDHVAIRELLNGIGKIDEAMKLIANAYNAFNTLEESKPKYKSKL